MRYGPDDPFWVVVDATPQSEMGDVLFKASLRDLERQFKGGLSLSQNPTIFTDRGKAEIEAQGRTIAARTFQAIAKRAVSASLEGVRRIKLLDGDGNAVCELDLVEMGL